MDLGEDQFLNRLTIGGRAGTGKLSVRRNAGLGEGGMEGEDGNSDNGPGREVRGWRRSCVGRDWRKDLCWGP